MSKLHLYRKAGESPHWHAQVYVGGKRYRFTCKTADKATAREYARQRVQELRERHNRGLVGLPEPVRFSEVLSQYEREELPKLRPTSRDRVEWILREIRPWFVRGALKDPLIGSITAAHISAYLEWKARTGVGPRSVNYHRAVLHRILRLAVRPWLLIPTNPVALVERLREERRTIPAPLTLAMVSSLVAHVAAGVSFGLP